MSYIVVLKFSESTSRHRNGWYSAAKATPLLRLKYREAISNAVAELGKPVEIGILFARFQNFQRPEGRKAGCTRRADGR